MSVMDCFSCGMPSEMASMTTCVFPVELNMVLIRYVCLTCMSVSDKVRIV